MNWFTTATIAALNWPALWVVEDELVGGLEDVLLEELLPQPDNSTSVAAIALLRVIHDLDRARESRTTRL